MINCFSIVTVGLDEKQPKCFIMLHLSRCICGPSWARTSDPLIMSQML